MESLLIFAMQTNNAVQETLRQDLLTMSRMELKDCHTPALSVSSPQDAKCAGEENVCNSTTIFNVQSMFK